MCYILAHTHHKQRYYFSLTRIKRLVCVRETYRDIAWTGIGFSIYRVIQKEMQLYWKATVSFIV